MGHGEGQGAIGERKFGYNPGVGTTEVEVRSEDADLAYQTTEQSLEILSASGNDDLVGTGAQKVTIQGVDGNCALHEETVDMDGATPVAIPGKFLRVNRAFVDDVGSGGKNAGLITVRLASAGAIQIVIQANEGQSESTSFTLEQGKKMIIKQIDYSVGSAGGAAVVVLFRFFFRTPGKSWRMFNSEVLINGSNHIPFNNDEEDFEEKTDIRITAQKLFGTGDARAEVGFSYRKFLG